MRMYSTSHSPRRSGWKPLLHMPQPAKCTIKAGLSTHGLSMSSHLGRPGAHQRRQKQVARQVKGRMQLPAAQPPGRFCFPKGLIKAAG